MSSTDMVTMSQGERGILEFSYKYPGQVHVSRTQDRICGKGMGRTFHG